MMTHKVVPVVRTMDPLHGRRQEPTLGVAGGGGQRLGATQKGVIRKEKGGEGGTGKLRL